MHKTYSLISATLKQNPKKGKLGLKNNAKKMGE